MLPVLRRLCRISTFWPSLPAPLEPGIADVGHDGRRAVVDDDGGEIADAAVGQPRPVLPGDPARRSLQVGREEGPERRRGAGAGGQRVEEVRRVARHGARAAGHGLGQGQAALELGHRPVRPQLLEKPVPLPEKPLPSVRRGRESGIVGQDGQESGLGPAQLFGAPAEIEPRGGVDADDVAAEGRVGGEERQDLLFERRVSSRRARTASLSFSIYVRGRFLRASRTTCMVIVLAPLRTFPLRKFCRAARATARGSIPG